jgi:hypothetical protein
VVAATEYTSDIFGSVHSVTELAGVVTTTFGASRFEMAIIFGVSVPLAVGSFKFDCIFLQIFIEKYVLVIWCRFEFYIKRG